MEELHFLSDEEKIIRLNWALDRAIAYLVVDGNDCPMCHVDIADCVYSDKYRTCNIIDDGYDCWRWHLTMGGR
jgi:hypothetical protein